MLINGQPATSLPITDRGLAYGDGVFETMRYAERALLFRELHVQRLEASCNRLGLALDRVALDAEISTVLQSADTSAGILKLIVTRGPAGRGYRPPPQASCSRILSLHPLPDYGPLQPEQGVRAFLCRQRLAEQPALAGIKHLNRLEQVLASSEWPDESFMEGVMLDMHDRIIEGTRSNLFIVRDGRLQTPDLSRCGIDGIMRQLLLRNYGNMAQTGDYTLSDLLAADEVFFCNSVVGVWPLVTLQLANDSCSWPAGPVTREAQTLFAAALQR
jgi:4-amino-4-deoxychorismate lyase